MVWIVRGFLLLIFAYLQRRRCIIILSTEGWGAFASCLYVFMMLAFRSAAGGLGRVRLLVRHRRLLRLAPAARALHQAISHPAPHRIPDSVDIHPYDDGLEGAGRAARAHSCHSHDSSQFVLLPLDSRLRARRGGICKYYAVCVNAVAIERYCFNECCR